ncbi:membrane protein [Rhodococcus phage WC1]|uniref:Uncharacterized protein n=2 Tax=Rerduovirus TaxID=1982375 RepID=A0A0K2CM56_9CAUD|nr:hypothetical protein AU091_gp42 [Rhodococcus phage CosmicSans]YP_010060243.1 membrane protein [Rhodococcus phage PhailMary]ALA46234.1 hypothetical protein PBI_RHODALYSA_31 [Rhodococcus phage Rhodalysa]ALN97075.1 hypothetical protein SEA_TWAMP_31 [Rhodococcus phage TWAMP]ALO80629.1 hypothetical protein SEA_LILLIE_31 [Rhodococcus phage Lillie]AOQ27480.1 hypothetical protein SEA_NATOSALEDA_31 [Rhodococcus phage Natosaleda]ASR84280.1 hypothetical protein SEA_STCROIX_31 [Rhodococcus phage StCro
MTFILLALALVLATVAFISTAGVLGGAEAILDNDPWFSGRDYLLLAALYVVAVSSIAGTIATIIALF